MVRSNLYKNTGKPTVSVSVWLAFQVYLEDDKNVSSNAHRGLARSRGEHLWAPHAESYQPSYPIDRIKVHRLLYTSLCHDAFRSGGSNEKR